MRWRDFRFEHRHIRAYEMAEKTAPVVCSLDYEECGEALIARCSQLGGRSFNLISVSHLQWDEELSPWPADSIITKNDRFTGSADTLLHVLTEGIIPETEAAMGWKPSVRVLAGYSMSGLFALYAAFKTSLFNAIVSASGSLWYPEITVFAVANTPAATVRRAYFSIGDKESRTRHPYLKTTESRTREVVETLGNKGIDTIFELNPGNHFNESTLREAKGIVWALR